MAPGGRRNTGLALIAACALIGATVWMLDALAHRQFTGHLRNQAAHALALATRGDTPYRWRMQSADDLVAGRVFGASETAFEPAGLSVLSDGTPFEIGLPLSRPVDLRHFPLIRADVAVDALGELRVEARERLESPELSSAPVPLAPGQASAEVALSEVEWLRANPTAPHQTMPQSAAMLRLRVTLPAGKRFHLYGVLLRRAPDAVPPDLNLPIHVVEPGASAPPGTSIVYRLPFRPDIQQMEIAAIVANSNPHAAPLILLPQHGRVEQQIALRNAIFAALPAAVLIPESELDASFSQAREEVAAARDPEPSRSLGWRWSLAALYALAQLVATRFPLRSARGRALVELVLALAGPLWLIVGGQFGTNVGLPELALIALAVVYSVSLHAPEPWGWNGSARAWGYAAAICVLAVALGLAFHDGASAHNAIGVKHVVRYVGWALLQQYLVCVVCTQRLRIITGRFWAAVYLGALAFALLHTPNAALMSATFLGGLGWCALYLREHALLPIAISHAVSALVLLTLLPADVLRSAEVSARFFM